VAGSLDGRNILITGIADEQSLALIIARRLREEGARLICAGLGETQHQGAVSPATQRFLRESRERFEKVVHENLGGDTTTIIFDASIEESVVDAANELKDIGLSVDGVLHSIALDRTIRGEAVKPLLDVSRQEFMDCMNVSAYSLIAITRALHQKGRLTSGASIVSLSYLGAERIMSHPYRNIGVAKAALERITRELAIELGRTSGIRLNAIRFSPYSSSRAGGAIPGLEDAAARANEIAPLGNATPEALAREIAYLMHPETMITGETRHVDGGYHVMG